MRSHNVYDILAEAKGDLAEVGGYSRVLGGIAANAIIGSAHIDWKDQTIVLDKDAYLSLVREENGTKRDIDVVSLSTNKTDTGRVKSVFAEAVGSSLAVSVFGLRRSTNGEKSHRFDFVSRHAVTASGMYQMQLDSVVTNLPDNWCDQWNVYRNFDDNMPIFTTMSPLVIKGCYDTRSIAGLRPKDRDKVERLQKRIDQDEIPEQYYIQRQASELHSLRIAERRRNDLWFAAKARVLSRLESRPGVVKFIQQGAEKAVAPIIGRS